MTIDGDEDKQIYQIVINHEEQYSIWPEGRELPRGWKAVGKSGPRIDCQVYIKEVWTDMRPLSLREAMKQAPERRGD